MTSALRQLGRPAMQELARALDTGRLTPPWPEAYLSGCVPSDLLAPVRRELHELARDGMAPSHIARLLHILAAERAATQASADRVELVWSGPETRGSASRETAVVAQDLFRKARRRVLIASYALDRGDKARTLFGELATRMDTEPALEVTLFVNVHRPHGDTTSDAVLLRQFMETFRDGVWPGDRLPKVYHDPRSLQLQGDTRACLHAKCVVIDDDEALVTSANFTEAAHARNIEAGVHIADPWLARSLRNQFESLIDEGVLRLVPGPSH